MVHHPISPGTPPDAHDWYGTQFSPKWVGGMLSLYHLTWKSKRMLLDPVLHSRKVIMLEKVGVLCNSCGCAKILQTMVGGSNNKILYLTFLEARSARSKWWQIHLLVKTVFLAFRKPCFHGKQWKGKLWWLILRMLIPSEGSSLRTLSVERGHEK